MTTAFSIADDGRVIIHDAHDTMIDLERALRFVEDLWCRQLCLGIASAAAYREYLPAAVANPDPLPPTVENLERGAIALAALGLRLGDQYMFRVLGAYARLRSLAQQDVLADLVLQPGLAVVNNAIAAEHPMAYLTAAVRGQIVTGGYEPQSRMVELSDNLTGAPVTVTAGIDASHYASILRASGRASDRRLAATIVATADGARKNDVGDNAYQQMLYHYEQPRAKEIAGKAGEPFTRAAGDGVMVKPAWFYTHGRRLDSVWHCANSHLLRGESKKC
jgi:hypothetical protein